MKIGFVTSNANFHEAIVQELSRRGHEVLLYRHTDDPLQNSYQLGQLAALAERVFVDWVQPPLEQVLAAFDCPIFVRCHRIEMYSDSYIAGLPWDKVSCLLFVADHVRERFLAKLSTPPRRVETLGHVGVDTDFWCPAPGKRLWEPPWRVIVAGNIVPKKRVYTAVQLVHDVGQDFHLELYGSGGQPGYGNPEYPANVSDLIEELGMAARMRSERHLSPEELRRRLQQAHIILCPSNEEGCATVVAEGMSCGLLPAINAWRGAKNVYPEEWVWRSPLELYRMLRQWAKTAPEEKAALAGAMREFVVARYDVRDVVGRLCDIVTGSVAGETAAGEVAAPAEEEGSERHQRALELVRRYLPPGGSFLDLGCGTGYVARRIAQDGAFAYGQDISRAAVAHARAQNPGYAVFQIADATAALMTGPHHVILAAELLGEVDPRRHEALLVRIAHELAPGGVLVCTFATGGARGACLFPKVLRRQCIKAGLQVRHYGENEASGFEIVATKGVN